MQQLDSMCAIRPSDITASVVTSDRGMELMTIAASNMVRELLARNSAFQPREGVSRIVTRIHPSLDNSFAELLVRSCTVSAFPAPAYEERLVFGSAAELRPELNAGLAGATLIGIGGLHHRTDLQAVYDEHVEGGRRKRDSASQVVCDELIAATVIPATPGVAAVLREINSIDSSGGSSYDHLGAIAKGLHLMTLSISGFAVTPLPVNLKRAVLGASLAAVCADEFSGAADDALAVQTLEKAWRRHLDERAKGSEQPSTVTIREVLNRTLQNPGLLVKGEASRLILRRVMLAVSRCWHPAAAELTGGVLLESILQMQQGFERAWNANLSATSVMAGIDLVYYETQPSDVLPHRGILANMSKRGRKAILVIRNSASSTFALFPSHSLPAAIWESFVTALIERESSDVWYIPTSDDGRRSRFVLNGTEWNVDRRQTQMGVVDFAAVAKQAVLATTKNQGRPPFNTINWQ